MGRMSGIAVAYRCLACASLMVGFFAARCVARVER